MFQGHFEENKPLKSIFWGSNGHDALQVYKTKLFLDQKCKKIFLSVKVVQKTEKRFEKTLKFFFHKTNSHYHI